MEPENPGQAAAPESPYRNLWVPLVLVPAAIVVAIVLVFVFFGAISGAEKTPSDNLNQMLRGGANERTQAAWNLVLQLQENYEALAAGRETEWAMADDFRRELSGAWEATADDDYAIRYILASLQAQLGEPGGVPHLVELLATTGAEEGERSGDFRKVLERVLPGGGEGVLAELKIKVLFELGLLADGMSPENREQAGAAVLAFLDDADLGLRLAAAAALQNLPGPEAAEALAGLLGSEELDLRGQAAISLSHLRDARGADVLRELAGLEAYEDERAATAAQESGRRARWGTEHVSNARKRAVEALGRLGLPADRPLLLRLAEDEPDLAVRQAAMRALEAG